MEECPSVVFYSFIVRQFPGIEMAYSVDDDIQLFFINLENAVSCEARYDLIMRCQGRYLLYWSRPHARW